MICLAVSTEYRRVADGLTDRRMDRHLATLPRDIVRATHTHRAFKMLDHINE